MTARGLTSVAAGCLLLFLAAGEAGAHPAFARKYRTSCQTCHVVFPYLTPFGESFRQNGFFFPGGADPDFIKDQPLQLGAEGYKQVFPDAVWPADVSGLPPVAFVIESELEITPDEETDVSLDGLGAGFEILTGGTIGENVSYYGEIEIEAEGSGETEVGIERLYAIWHFFGSDDPRLRLWVGRFEPHLGAISNHRRLNIPRYLIRSSRTGDNAWSPEAAQQGFDLGGIIKQRVVWNLGLVEGSRNLANDEKDFYAHVGVKLGGMPYAPQELAETTLTAANPWAERSVEIHAFVYRGVATFDDPAGIAPGTQDDDFVAAGAEARLRYDNWIVDLAFDVQDHDSPVFGSTESRDVTNLIAEAAYVVYPWLIPVLRFEYQSQDGAEDVRRVSLAIDFVIRANVKGQIGWIHTETDETEDEFVITFVLAF